MQILSVELENVKSYEDAKVDFTPGVNAIVGHNGAGKSTILEAIGFVLFDTLDYAQAEFVRAGAKSAKATVTFLSSADERAYQVIRRIGSGAQYYIFDPELEARICDGKADVLRFLRQHLRVEPGTDLTALFKDAVGVPQGTLTAAFLLAEGPRKKVFDALLQVEEYQKVWDRLREPINLIKSRKHEVQLEIASTQGRLERLPALQAAVGERRVQMQATTQTLKTTITQFATVQEQRLGLEQVRKQVLAAERTLAQGKQRYQGLQAKLFAAQQALADAVDASKIVAANQDGYLRYQEAQATQAELDQQVRQRQQLEQQRNSADKQLALLDAEARKLAQELTQIAEAEATAQALQPQVEEQGKLEQAFAIAQQQQARLKDAQRNANQQRDTVQRLQLRVAELESQVAHTQTLVDEKLSVEQQIVVLQGTLEQQRADQQEFKTRAELIKEQTAQLQDIATAVCPVCEQPLTPQHRQDLLARNATQLLDLRQQYANMQKQVREQEATLQTQQQQAQKLQSDLLRLPRPAEVVQVRQELTRAQAAQVEAEAQAETLLGAADEVARLTQQLAGLGDPRRRYTVAAEQAKRRDSVEAQQKQAEQQRKTARKALDELATALARFADLDAQIDAVNATLKQHRAAYQAVLSSQRQAGELANRQSVAEQLGAEAMQLQQEVVKLESRHQEVARQFDGPTYDKLAAQEQQLQGEMGGLRATLNMQEQAQQRDEQEILALRALESTLSAAQTRLAYLEQEEDVLEHIRGLLRQAGPYITRTLIRQISDGARQIFGDLMQDYTRHLGWSENYGITLDVAGHSRQFAQLSGGEQMCAALAVRLALLREMSSINVAFFDEPTANLDEARREQLARQILQVRGFQQLFVISHDDTFEQAMQNLIRVERVDGISRVNYS